MSTMEAQTRLLRPRDGRMIGGVCAAFARRFGVDVSLIRIAWAIAVLCFGVGLLAYVLCWIIIPLEDPLR